MQWNAVGAVCQIYSSTVLRKAKGSIGAWELETRGRLGVKAQASRRKRAPSKVYSQYEVQYSTVVTEQTAYLEFRGMLRWTVAREVQYMYMQVQMHHH